MKVITNPGENSYCGPAALSLLTGFHVSLCCHELRLINRKRAIKGCSDGDMIAALLRLKKRVREVPLHPNTLCEALRRRPTLVGAVRLLKTRTPAQRFLIRTTGHFLVLSGRKVYDNLNPTGVFFGDYNRRRMRVKHMWEVSA
jgi:hypothetical protein